VGEGNETVCTYMVMCKRACANLHHREDSMMVL
jgi:hypothetical protein